MERIAWPVPVSSDGRPPHVTSGYGPRTGGHYAFHYGVDILYPHAGEPLRLPFTSGSGRWSMPGGIPALAAASGVVTKSSRIGTGERVRVDHGGGLATGYFHLSSRKVAVGDRVRRGQPLGIIGYDPSGGGVALNHLHFEAYRNGQNFDPEDLLRNAEFLPMPTSWLLLAALAVGGGLLVARYL